MRVVYEAWNLIDAYLVRHALEDAGIPVFGRGETLLAVGEVPACGPVAACVLDSCWPRARAMVESLPLLVGEADADSTRLDRAMPA